MPRELTSSEVAAITGHEEDCDCCYCLDAYEIENGEIIAPHDPYHEESHEDSCKP